MIRKRSKKEARKGKGAVRKANRRMTPEEQRAMNVVPEAPVRRKAKSARGHVKPLEAQGQKSTKRTPRQRRPNPLGGLLQRTFAPLRRSLTGEWLGAPDVIRHLPFAAFLGLLFIGYIFLQYRYEYDERAIKEGRKELRNLRHHEQALRGRFESQLQRSRLDEAMADIDLAAPDTPPTLLPDATTP